MIDVLNNKQDKLIAGSGITIASDGKTISSSGGSWKVYTGTLENLFSISFVGSTHFIINMSKTININFLHRKYDGNRSNIYSNNISLSPFTYKGELTNGTAYLTIGEVKLGLSGTSDDGGKGYVYIRMSKTSGNEIKLRADEYNSFTLKNTNNIEFSGSYARYAIINVFE